MKINLKDIQAKAKFYAKELWNMDYDLPITINDRITSTLGRFYPDKTTKGLRIELSKDMFQYYNELFIDDTLLHELCHWYCWKTNKGFHDGDADFENELKKHGISSSGTDEFAGKEYVGICSKCGSKIVQKRSKSALTNYCNYYISKCCKAQIINGGEIIHEDNNKVSDKIIDLNIKYKLSYYNNVS